MVPGLVAHITPVDGSIVATEELLLLHTPAPPPQVSGEHVPVHKFVAPVIGPGSGLTVTTDVV